MELWSDVMTPDEFRLFRDLIHNECGIFLKEEKKWWLPPILALIIILIIILIFSLCKDSGIPFIYPIY